MNIKNNPWHLVLLALSSLFPVIGGCERRALTQDEKIIIESLKQIAPKDGVGFTHYNYASGEKLQEIEWKNFEIVNVRWYRKDGTLVWETPVEDNRCIAVELDDQGCVTAVYETFGLSKSGKSIVFDAPVAGHFEHNSL